MYTVLSTLIKNITIIIIMQQNLFAHDEFPMKLRNSTKVLISL